MNQVTVSSCGPPHTCALVQLQVRWERDSHKTASVPELKTFYLRSVMAPSTSNMYTCMHQKAMKGEGNIRSTFLNIIKLFLYAFLSQENFKCEICGFFWIVKKIKICNRLHDNNVFTFTYYTFALYDCVFFINLILLIENHHPEFTEIHEWLTLPRQRPLAKHSLSTAITAWLQRSLVQNPTSP